LANAEQILSHFWIKTEQSSSIFGSVNKVDSNIRSMMGNKMANGGKYTMEDKGKQTVKYYGGKMPNGEEKI
jgi:hypothetical protein